MKKFGRKALALMLGLVLCVSMFAFTGCGGSSSDPASSGLVDSDIKGDISIMTWGGDGKYHEDIGSEDLSDSKLTSQNVAQVYAVAKKFKEKYPNVKINIWAKAGDPNQPGTPSWDQEIENFKTKYGKYPDIWGADDIISDIKKGLVADLSVYEKEDSYKAYNKTLMKQMNYGGMQAGLPSYTIPWGIWINKSLAADNNIDVPDPDWSIQEFTDFVNQADKETFFGMKCAATDPAGHDGHGPMDILDMGVPTINKQIKEKNSIDLNTDEVKSLLKYASQWAASSVDSAEGAETLSTEIAQENMGYSWTYFVNNRTLINVEDPWYLTAGADPSNKKSNVYIKAKDWDFYPFPSTEYMDDENTIKLVIDPICLHNYALDDSNPQMSKKERSQLDLTYTFATYWTASTEARQAIYDQGWTQDGVHKDSAASDTFPVVTGDAYDEQMDIWNEHPAHKVYKDKEGFQKVIKLFKEGKSWDYVDKCWTKKISEHGEEIYTLQEWISCNDKDVAGAWMTDKNWADSVKSKLADWNKTINKRIKKADAEFKTALKKYYGNTK